MLRLGWGVFLSLLDFDPLQNSTSVLVHVKHSNNVSIAGFQNNQPCKVLNFNFHRPRICIINLHHSFASFFYTIYLHHSFTPFICIIHLHHSFASFIYNIHLHHSFTPLICIIHLHNSFASKMGKR